MHDQTTTNPADEAAIRDMYREMMDGWNQGSGAAFAAFLLWTLSDLPWKVFRPNK